MGALWGIIMNESLNKILSSLSQRLSPLYSEYQTQLQHAWWLLEHVTGLSRLQLLCAVSLDYDDILKKLDLLILEHVDNHKPLAYIIGSIPFCGTTILVEPPLLIPRMETEEWVEILIDQLIAAQELLTNPLSILDLCSGSGCIAVALARAFPQAHITALDIEPRAIELIKKNINYNNISNITLIQSDLFGALERYQQFDLIVSNPPYITTDEYQQLDKSVKDWEDPKALFADDEGLALIKKIVTQAPAYIRCNAVLKEYAIPQIIMEIGHTQANVVKAMMNGAGYSDVYVQKDFAEKDRTVMGRIDYAENQKTTSNVQRGSL